MKNKKLEWILAVVVVVITILCAAIYFKDKKGTEIENDIVTETTTIQEETTEPALELEDETMKDDGFSELIPIN